MFSLKCGSKSKCLCRVAAIEVVPRIWMCIAARRGRKLRGKVWSRFGIVLREPYKD
ncbi:unnamed protein product, partial [Nesidiocoris tenuis]